MRASPAFQISLTRFGVWRIAVLAVTQLGLGAIAAWIVGREQALWIHLAAALAGVPLVWVGWRLARIEPVDLRWDGRTWHLAAAGDLSDAALQGELHATIDLGPWMLLRFVAPAPHRAGVVWLPVQRLGIATQWHALRCAVYAPRPVAE
jgi:hypothetical protein